MADETDTQGTVEVVEQLEEEQIDLNVVRWFAGEGEPQLKQKQRLDSLYKERGDDLYSDLVFVLLGRRYLHADAHKMWDRIISHRNVLKQALGRNPGIVVAALDWVTNVQDEDESVGEISLIESDKLDDMLERAVVDTMTGLYDHGTLLALLEKELERAKRHSEKLSLIMLDLDDFKQINDEFGHQKGDEVLIRLADIMCETVRTMDIASRYGGEEFSVILPETDISAAVHSAERLRKAVEEGFAQNLKLTISVGVACFPNDGEDVDALVKAADEALYQAKAHGKNQVRFGEIS